MAKKPQLKTVTPRGELMYPFLFGTDAKFNKFNKDGVYRVDLLLNLEDAETKKFMKKVKGFQKETEAGPKLPLKVDKDAGTAMLRCKSSTQPKIVDAKKNPITRDPQMGNGTIGKLAVTFTPHENGEGGLSCYVRGVQVVDLKIYEPDVDDFDVEDGFTVEDSGDVFEPSSATTEEAAGSDDDFPF